MEKTENKELDSLKSAHDYYATAIHIFKTRVQWYHEEFSSAGSMIHFLNEIKEQILKKIHEVEPPKPQEQKAPLVIDVPGKPPRLEVVR